MQQYKLSRIPIKILDLTPCQAAGGGGKEHMDLDMLLLTGLLLFHRPPAQSRQVSSYVILYLHTVVQKSTCRIILIHVIQTNNLKDGQGIRSGCCEYIVGAQIQVAVSRGLVHRFR